MSEFIATMLYIAADQAYRFGDHNEHSLIADAMTELWYAGAWEYFA